MSEDAGAGGAGNSSADKGTDPAAAPSNHSPKFLLDESALDIGFRSLMQLTLDYLHGT